MLLNVDKTNQFFKREHRKNSDSNRIAVVIPAAGVGRRLAYPQPKILYDFGGYRPLDIFYHTLADEVFSVVLVVSPEGEPVIRREVEKLSWKASFALQEVPYGMAHAILCARDFTDPFEHTLILWGDQVSVVKSTLEKTIGLHLYSIPKPTITFPLVEKENPYIVFEWDVAGKRLVRVLQAREKDRMPFKGLNDCGIFLARTCPLFDLLFQEWMVFSKTLGQKNNKEFNFLPLIPHWKEKALGFVIEDEGQTLGLNTLQEAKHFKAIFQRRV